MSFEEENPEVNQDEIQEQIENTKKVEIGRIYYFGLPYPPNRDKLDIAKTYEHGAHFKYLDLFSKLINLVLVVPCDRIGRKSNFIQNENDKISANFPGHFKIIPKKKDTFIHKSLLSSFRDIKDKTQSRLLSLEKEKEKNLNEFKYKIPMVNINKFNCAVKSLKHQNQNPIKLYKAGFKKTFYGNNTETFSPDRMDIIKDKDEPMKILSFDRKDNLKGKSPEKGKLTLPELNNSNYNQKLSLSGINKNRNEAYFNTSSLFHNKSSRNKYKSPNHLDSFQKKGVHVFSNKQIFGLKTLELSQRPFIKFVHT